MNSYINSISTLGHDQLPGLHRPAVDAPRTFRVRFQLKPYFLEPPSHAQSRSKSKSQTVVLTPISAIKGSREKLMTCERKSSVDTKHVDRARKNVCGGRLGSGMEFDDDDDDNNDFAKDHVPQATDKIIDDRDDLSDISEPASPGLDGSREDGRGGDDFVFHEQSADDLDGATVSALLNSVELHSRNSVVSSASSKVSDLYHFVGLDNRLGTISVKGKSRDSVEREKTGRQDRDTSTKSKASIHSFLGKK